ncbi:Tetratricopeptide repeat protein 8 [Araneus ventricosus]|uniref:Tetratricopeptide repeat protein 8 n=1 Tax=Araneus ventricosus TaxID=182803 RepID=A0A4Y2C2E2_ARAVE|nr:Tetratricopeptide repeat protein 8 [Araneus ventricosus]
MDPLFQAISYYRRHHFEKCVDICTKVLEEKPYDEAAWTLKMKALTLEVYVDDLETDEEGIADIIMDENSIAQMARPGTSLKNPNSAKGTSQAYRPVTQSGRPLSGVVRPGTQSGRPGTMEQAIRTRTAFTSRPITSSSGRFVRLGTASMLSQPDGPFINFARLNISKYAALPHIAKHLFEYAYYHDNDIRQALDIAAQATQACRYEDWWWKFQLGKCYYRFGMFRDAEKQFKSAIKQQDMIDTYLWLGKVYIGLDQPLAALDVYKQGLEKFPQEVFLMVHTARIYEELNDLDLAVKYYKDVLNYEAIDVEAIACIAAHHFYNDQPEVALRYYRRLLQMGVCNSELYNNLALCCFYSQQNDMAVMCFERALSLATDETLPDVWYNIAHLSLGIGDKSLATQCLRLALVANNDHAESYNNLGVIEGTKGNLDQSKAFFVAASNLAQHLFEPHFNQALLAEKMGDLQNAYFMVQKSLEAYPDHTDSKDLFQRIKDLFTTL